MKRNSDRGIKETEYLLRSPANAKRLLESIRESKEGKGQVMSVEELRKSVGLSVCVRTRVLYNELCGIESVNTTRCGNR